MVKHTQRIRRLLADKLSVFDHFVGLTLKGLRPCQIPMMNSFAKIVTTAVNYFLKKSPSETFERLNTPLLKFK